MACYLLLSFMLSRNKDVFAMAKEKNRWVAPKLQRLGAYGAESNAASNANDGFQTKGS
jgi:hypothetical protein